MGVSIVGICPAGGRPHPFPCGGLIREHRMDAMWLKATMSFVAERDHREKYVFPIISSTFVVHRTIKVCLHTNKQYC